MNAMCTEPSLTAARESEPPQSEAAADLPDESEPIENASLAPAPALAVEPAAVPDLVPLRDDELPWCATPDDPSCSPLPANSSPSAMAVRAAPAIATNVTFPRSSLGVDMPFSSAGTLPPALGITQRVERPPR